MKRSPRALRMLLCAGALLSPLAMTAPAQAESASPYGRYTYGTTTRNAGEFWIDGHQHYFACSDDVLYQIAFVARQYGYYTSVDGDCLTIRTRRGYALPRISWVADLSTGVVSYKGDCVTFTISAAAYSPPVVYTTRTYYTSPSYCPPTYRYYTYTYRHTPSRTYRPSKRYRPHHSSPGYDRPGDRDHDRRRGRKGGRRGGSSGGHSGGSHHGGGHNGGHHGGGGRHH